MDLHLISDIDLEKLDEELNSERLSFKDVANYICGLKIDNEIEQNNNLVEHYEQSLKLIRISQVLLKYAVDKVLKEPNGELYVFQCTNCSKAFRKSEYLENHVQRRHGSKSLAENGLFPLIEQIKRYNSGLFVESSSIDDLKGEIKNLQTCLKETSEDLIKEKIAREQLQRIIESEIIEKLNSLQETWSDSNGKEAQSAEKANDEEESDSNENNENHTDKHSADHAKDHNDMQPKSQDFNLFLIKQNELIEKLGQNIDRFVERNDESKLEDKQLENFISTAIHREIESLLANNKEPNRKAINGNNETKDVVKLKKTNNNRRYLARKELFALSSKDDELRQVSLHEFSIQNHLNSTMQYKDHTDEIVNEINQIITDEQKSNETLVKQPSKNSSFKKKIRKFSFKFRKSKSLIQLNGTNETAKDEMKSEIHNTANEDIKDQLRDQLKDQLKNELRYELKNELKRKDELKDEMKSKNAEKEKSNEKVSDRQPAMSRFRQFVWKKAETEQTDNNKISLNKFSSKKSDEVSAPEEANDLTAKKLSNDENNKNDKNQQVAGEVSNMHKTLKSVLKKSNSTDSSLQQQQQKLTKKIAFSDERIEFSAEEPESSSDTGSNYSFSTTPAPTNYTLPPTEQIVTVQKVIESFKPTPAPRFIQHQQEQQKTLTSL